MDGELNDESRIRNWTSCASRTVLALAGLVSVIIASGAIAGGSARNWSYAEMEDWQTDQPPEKRIGQARWDVAAGAWYFNFGPTGVRVAFDVDAPRVAKVMYVFPDSPADKKIQKGDEIVGVNGKTFTSNEPFPDDKSFAIKGPRLEVAKAIEESEGDPKLKGILTFTVRRDGKTFPVELQLEMLGYFSPTFPYNCEKSRILAERAGDWLIENRRDGKHLLWGPPRMGDWIDMPAHLALLSFGDRYKTYMKPEGSGGAMWSWISGVRLIAAAEKQQSFRDKALVKKLGEMSKEYAAKSGPSGAYSHKNWYEGAPFQLAFAAGLNGLGQALAYRCGADIDEESYLRTRYLLTVKTNEKGNIGYGAANRTPYSAEEARKAVGKIKPSVVKTDELARWRQVGGSACTTLIHFVDPRDRYSEAFVKRGVRNAMASRWSCRQGHACGSLTLVYNTLAASIAPIVGEEEMYRAYMDDMKWWLNMSRCHNGGWYFDPKVDKECNKNDRIHTTTAAILMLNAPLRQLYCNGKGHADPGSAGPASTTSITRPTAVTQPARKARTLTPKRRKTLESALRSTLIKVSESGGLKEVSVRISRTRARVWLEAVDRDGMLTFQLVGGTQTGTFTWDELNANDHATLSLLLAELKPESGDVQAMAGVFLESAGRRNEAETYYERADKSSSDKLQKLFD